jgi:hypothetical protein
MAISSLRHCPSDPTATFNIGAKPKEKIIMSTATVEATQPVFGYSYRTTPTTPIGGVTMTAVLSFKVGSEGADRSFGTLTGHVSLTQGGVEKPNIGDFVVIGTFADFKITPPEAVSIYFESAPSPVLGQQTIRGHMLLANGWKQGTTTFSYTPEGGHPIITVPNQKIEAFVLEA